MKAKQLQIPNPCSENWTLMTSQAEGRFCQSCTTVVRDFSKMSDTQIRYVLSHSGTKICGRFREDQLNRNIEATRYRNAPDLLAVVLGMTVLLSAYPAYSNTQVYETAPISLIQLLDEDTTKISDDHDYVKIRFEILEKDSQVPVPFAKVIVKGQNDEFYAGMQSDFDGHVSFQLTPDQLSGAAYLEVSTIDFGHVEIAWDSEWKGDNQYKIELEEQINWLMGDVYIVPADEKKKKRKRKREN